MEILGTILFALLWFVLGAIAMIAFSAWNIKRNCDKFGEEDTYDVSVDRCKKLMDILFPKK